LVPVDLIVGVAVASRHRQRDLFLAPGRGGRTACWQCGRFRNCGFFHRHFLQVNEFETCRRISEPPMSKNRCQSRAYRTIYVVWSFPRIYGVITYWTNPKPRRDVFTTGWFQEASTGRKPFSPARCHRRRRWLFFKLEKTPPTGPGGPVRKDEERPGMTGN
jgi:hypothetical protein